MESATQSPSKRIPAGKTFKVTAIDEAGDALAALEANAGTYAAKATVTAADIIEAHLEAILRMQGKGIPLAVIYKEMRSKVRLKIEYKTFKQYVSRAAVGRGISRRTAPATAPATPTASTVVAEPSASPATATVMEAAPMLDMENHADAARSRVLSEGWKCPECPNGKPDMYKGKRFFECGACGTCYAGDADGNMTQELFNG